MLPVIPLKPRAWATRNINTPTDTGITQSLDWKSMDIDSDLYKHIVVDVKRQYPAWQYTRNPTTQRGGAWVLPFTAVGDLDPQGIIANHLPPHQIEPVMRHINRKMHEHTIIITLFRSNSRGADDYITRGFLDLPNVQLLRCLHRGLAVSTPDVIAFQHVHVREGVRRYVYTSRDFRDLLAPGWRGAWRTVASLQELVVIYDQVASMPPPQYVGDADPATRPQGAAGGEPEAWQTVLGRSLTGPGIDVAMAARAAVGLPALKVILVGFAHHNKRPSVGKKAHTNYIPRQENAAVSHHLEIFTHAEYKEMVGRQQYLLETAI